MSIDKHISETLRELNKLYELSDCFGLAYKVFVRYEIDDKTIDEILESAKKNHLNFPEDVRNQSKKVLNLFKDLIDSEREHLIYRFKVNLISSKSESIIMKSHYDHELKYLIETHCRPSVKVHVQYLAERVSDQEEIINFLDSELNNSKSRDFSSIFPKHSPHPHRYNPPLDNGESIAMNHAMEMLDKINHNKALERNIEFMHKNKLDFMHTDSMVLFDLIKERSFLSKDLMKNKSMASLDEVNNTILDIRIKVINKLISKILDLEL